VALVDGRLIENLHVESANRILALADEIERLSGEKRSGGAASLR
jgi:uncharacterized small protein (DUF1192 family)